jgi:hypothetical protein
LVYFWISSHILLGSTSDPSPSTYVSCVTVTISVNTLPCLLVEMGS